MDNINSQIKLRCLFCMSDQFVIPDEEKQFQSGDQIVCANCGQTNDYDSLMRVAKKNAEEWATQQVNEMVKEFNKKVKNLFK